MSSSKLSLTRRSFLKWSAVLTAALSTTGLAGCKTANEQLKETSGPRDLTTNKIRTVCPRNCYSTCNFIAHEKDGRLVKIEGIKDHPVTDTPCLKGLSYTRRVYSPDRLKYPLKRVGERGEGKWKRISWEEAYQEMAENFINIKDKYGPESILYYTYSGSYGNMNEFGAKFFKLLGGYSQCYGSLCWPAGLEATQLTYGGKKYHHPKDFINSKLIILWGKNPVSTNVQEMKFIHEAREKGATLVVIDPLFTRTAAKADIHIRPRVGTDGALALGLAHIIVKENLHDQSFIAEHVKGFSEYKELIEKYTPEKVAEITEIPEETIIDLALMYGKTKPANIICGYGLQRHTNGGQMVRSIAVLPAITGNIGISGGGFNYANFDGYIFGGTGTPNPPEESYKIRNIGQYSKLGEAILKAKNPSIKAIMVERGNPLTVNPNTNVVKEGFSKAEYIVCIDQFITDSAEVADLVLPAKTLFEQTDIHACYWHHYIQLRQKVIDSPFEAKPESEIYKELARVCGMDLKYFDINPEQAVRNALEGTGITYEQLKKGPVRSPISRDVAWEDLKFPTPSGKIEIYSEEAEEKWGVDPLPVYEELKESKYSTPKLFEKYPLRFMSAHPKNRIHSQFGFLDWLIEIDSEPICEIHPKDAKERGIKTGDLVTVFNDRGQFTLKANVTEFVIPGMINVWEGWWEKHTGLTTNFVTPDFVTDMNNGAAYHSGLVQVEKV